MWLISAQCATTWAGMRSLEQKLWKCGLEFMSEKEQIEQERHEVVKIPDNTVPGGTLAAYTRELHERKFRLKTGRWLDYYSACVESGFDIKVWAESKGGRLIAANSKKASHCTEIATAIIDHNP